MSPEELKVKIDLLHSRLNEYYELDDSWRTIGEWPEGENGSILHPPATEEEIAQAEARFGHKFPPSYKEFLRLHSGWEHCWGNDTFVGTGRTATQRAQDKIAEYIRWQIDLLRKRSVDESPAATKAWEAAAERNLYLAHHLVIGTDFRGAAWVFDTRTRDANQEMKLTSWEMSYGAQDPAFQNFYEYLDFAIGEVDFRLEDWKKDAAKSAKKKKSPPAKAKVKAKTSDKFPPRKPSR
ncbi:MAG TPA: SMI1/KNR4 family protein [Vicinamibacterales bacterium]|jgi:cell wall assembly regulator SMI1|nr:SMI1/KNR4 family protein [Vicinamibacterales bacterium]